MDVASGTNCIIHRYKIAVVGAKGCGKTAFARRLARDIFYEADNALQNNSPPFRQFFHCEQSDGNRIKIELIDVSVEQLDEHVRTANTIRQRLVVGEPISVKCTEFVDLCGIFLLYDTTDSKSFDGLHNIIGDLSHLTSPGCEIFLIGCKSDLREQRKISFKEAEDFAIRIGFSLFETSSKSGLNCTNALMEMVDKIYEKQEEAACYICDSVEEEETASVQRFNIPNIFCNLWNCQ